LISSTSLLMLGGPVIVQALTQFAGPITVTESGISKEVTVKLTILSNSKLSFQDPFTSKVTIFRTPRSVKFARLRKVESDGRQNTFIFFVIDKSGVYGVGKFRVIENGRSNSEPTHFVFFDEMYRRGLFEGVSSSIIAHQAQLDQDVFVCEDGSVWRYFVDHRPKRIAQFESLRGSSSFKLSVTSTVCQLSFKRRASQAVVKQFKLN
jgi:hypothetical protein